MYIHIFVYIQIYIHTYICIYIIHANVYIYLYVHTSNLNCQELFAIWLKYNTHIQTLIHVHTHTHTHTKYAHAYVAHSLPHTHTHTRTHTMPRHAALCACHAVAPTTSAVVLTREALPQALRCPRARAPTKTRGKAGRFADLAYTAHGKNNRSLLSCVMPQQSIPPASGHRQAADPARRGKDTPERCD